MSEKWEAFKLRHSKPAPLKWFLFGYIPSLILFSVLLYLIRKGLI